MITTKTPERVREQVYVIPHSSNRDDFFSSWSSRLRWSLITHQRCFAPTPHCVFGNLIFQLRATGMTFAIWQNIRSPTFELTSQKAFVNRSELWCRDHRFTFSTSLSLFLSLSKTTDECVGHKQHQTFPILSAEAGRRARPDPGDKDFCGFSIESTKAAVSLLSITMLRNLTADRTVSLSLPTPESRKHTPYTQPSRWMDGYIDR